jgi:uncharacterized protein (TIGR02271 family)
MNRKELSGDHSIGNESQSKSLPVLEEQLQVGIRIEETGKVRVIKKVHEENIIVSTPVYNEDLHIERVPLNQYVDAPPQIRHEGDTMIIPVMKEEVILQTRLVLVEEVRITKHRTERTVEKPVTLRKEEIVIEKPEETSYKSDDSNSKLK